MNEAVSKLRDDEEIYRLVLYYSFFNYPLKFDEVLRSCPGVSDREMFNRIVDELIKGGLLVEKNGYLGINDSQLQIDQRIADENRLEKAKSKIERSIKVISRFPFVKSVMISGSVSKGVLKEDGDVDFFIITKNDRLWLTRTLLVLNKKVLRLNSRKYFCVNYFIGENELAIPDENMFTAVELNSLIPVYNVEIHKELLSANGWASNYIQPNSHLHADMEINVSSSRTKRFGEWLLKGAFGERLDRRLKKLTLKRWKKKFSHFGDEEFELAMRSERNVSKHHPSNFQLQILDYLENGMKEYQMKSNRANLHKQE